jgi:erythronate-4-phosphate dehydrogenase
MTKLRIIADSKIPYLRDVLEPWAEMRYLAPADVTPEAVADADALITRTRNHCDAALLEGSRVRMIATATIGYDHIDADYCREAGITWRNAPGCNAESVAQYVAATLSYIALRDRRPLSSFTIGIVGVGNVGKAVERVCRTLGMRVLRCDPPRAEREGSEGFVALGEIARQADVVTFHTPLTHDGEHATYHLADETFFEQLAHRPILINAARGGVVDEAALLKAHDAGRLGDLVIDCWEGEPAINPRLLEAATIATPHIAGYSADGKANATRMAVENIARFFGIAPDVSGIEAPAIEPHRLDASGIAGQEVVPHLILKSYSPIDDTLRLRKSPATFEKQRGDYPLRREPRAYEVTGVSDAATADVLSRLGFAVSER